MNLTSTKISCFQRNNVICALNLLGVYNIGNVWKSAAIWNRFPKRVDLEPKIIRCQYTGIPLLRASTTRLGQKFTGKGYASIQSHLRHP